MFCFFTPTRTLLSTYGIEENGKSIVDFFGMYIQHHRIDRVFPPRFPGVLLLSRAPSSCCVGGFFVSGFERGARRRRGRPVPENIDGEQRVKLAFFFLGFDAILTALELHP